MDRFEPAIAAARNARLLAMGLAALGAIAIGVALIHMIQTAQRGTICGLADGGHCWACYAAPLLGIAAIASWGWAKALPSPAHARR